MTDDRGFVARRVGRAAQPVGGRPEPTQTLRTTADQAPPAAVPLVIPPDHVSLRVLRAHVQQWDWMARSRDSLRVASGQMSLFDFYLAQRLRNARQGLIDRVDRGEQVTEDDLIKVMGADFTFGGEKVAIVTNVDRDVRPRAQGRSPTSIRWQRDGTATPDPPGGPVGQGAWKPDGAMSSATHEQSQDHARPELGAVSAGDDATGPLPSLTDWLNDDPGVLVSSLSNDAALAHAEACGGVLYEATVCAWARTMLEHGLVDEGQLPAAVRRWLADDGVVRSAVSNPRLRDTYFGDRSRESEALHRAQVIDVLSRTDPRASVVALSPVASDGTVEPMDGPFPQRGQVWRDGSAMAVSSLRESLRHLCQSVPEADARRTSPTETGSVHRAQSRVPGKSPGAFRRESPATDDGPVSAGVTPDVGAAKARCEVPDASPRVWATDLTAGAGESPAVAPSPEVVAEQARGTDARKEQRRREEDATGPAVWIRGRRISGIFVEMREDQVGIVTNGEVRTLRGPLHRDDGPAVVEPDGTTRYYINGVVSRDQGPAIEAAEPAYDVYAINGTILPLDLPPALLGDRLFRARMFRAWERAGFPVNAELQARAVLATMSPADRESVLRNVRQSPDPRDRQFCSSADALYASSGLPAVSVDPLIVDDYDPCCDALLSCGDSDVHPTH